MQPGVAYRLYTSEALLLPWRNYQMHCGDLIARKQTAGEIDGVPLNSGYLV
jgi:hypothetical protein